MTQEEIRAHVSRFLAELGIAEEVGRPAAYMRVKGTGEEVVFKTWVSIGESDMLDATESLEASLLEEARQWQGYGTPRPGVKVWWRVKPYWDTERVELRARCLVDTREMNREGW